MRFLSFAVASALLGAACGSNVSGAGGAGSTGDAGKGGGAAASPCPATEPSGGSCSEPGRHCTYGTSPRPECRHMWECWKDSTWMKDGTTSTTPCDQPGPGCSGLPASPDSVVCAKDGEVCVQGAATLCVCTSCPGGPCMVPPPKWTCAGPPSTPGCPAIAPNLGTACSTSNLSCTYGKPCSGSGAVVKCEAGAWVPLDVACPV